MLSVVRVVCQVFLIFFYIIESIVLKFVPAQFLYKKEIRGQIVLITGAGGGIGRLLALGLAKLGGKIVCWDVAKLGISKLRKQTVVN